MNPSSPAACPSQDQLQAFHRGQLPPALASQLVEHVARCPRCVETMRLLQAQQGGAQHVSTMVTGGGKTLGADGPTPRVAAPQRPAPGPSGNWEQGSRSGLFNDTQMPTDSLHDRPTQPAPTLRRTDTERTGEQVIGEYVILEKLGEGGMGEVYKARHRRMDRMVAMKVLPAEALGSVKAIERFMREVKASAKLTHPNIVAAYDAGEHEGLHYMVMEYVAGQDLNSLVETGGPIPYKQAVDYVIQAARGLDHAHKKGIVHRDIKPANLILDQEGVVKVLDMGLATLAGSQDGPSEMGRQTKTGIIMGTPAYMAPEQAADVKRADARADIYALGCVLHFLLTGHDPYETDSFLNTLIAHREAPIPALSRAPTPVPQPVEQVFRRMLAKSADERPQTAQELIRELEAALSAPGSRFGAAPGSTPSANAGPKQFGGSSLGLGTGFAGGQPALPSNPASMLGEAPAASIPGYDPALFGSSAPGASLEIPSAGLTSGPLSDPFGGAPAPVDTSAQELAEALIASGLVSADDLGAVLGRFGARLPSAQKLLSELARAGLLTSYQAGVLQQAHPADLCVGDYIVSEMVAEGPRATLYRAVHRPTGDQVAMKVSARADVPLAELQTAAQLRHPRLTPVLELTEQGDMVCQIFPYYPAGNLGRRVRKLGRLSVGEALAHIRGAGEALAFAAQHGLSHGAVGPANLLIDDKGHTHLSDLGWASVRSYAVSEEDALRSSSGSGLPEGNDLVAPELIGGGQPPDQASDVYSLGATLFFLLSGVPPKWDKHQGSVPVLGDFARDLPPGFQHVFAKMVAHDRAQRYATLTDALQALADPAAAEAADRVSEPVEEPPPEAVPFYKQPGGGAVITALIVLGVVCSVMGIRVALGAEFTPWDWGRAVVVAVTAGIVFQIKSFLLDISIHLPLLVGAVTSVLWGLYYFGLSLPAADLMADLCHITVGLASGVAVCPAACFLGFCLLSGIFAGAMSYRGAVFMASGAYLPVMAMAIFISGYEIKTPQDQAFEEDDEGAELLKKGEFQKAIAFYDKLVNSQPRRAGAWYNRGRAHDAVGNSEKAILDLTQAIKLRSKNPDGYSRRGDVYKKEKDFRKAFEDFNASLDLDRNQPKVRAKRGEMLLEMGEVKDALDDFNDAIVANDRDPTVYLARAKALEQMGKLTQAKADREKARALFEELSGEGGQK